MILDTSTHRSPSQQASLSAGRPTTWGHHVARPALRPVTPRPVPTPPASGPFTWWKPRPTRRTRT